MVLLARHLMYCSPAGLRRRSGSEMLGLLFGLLICNISVNVPVFLSTLAYSKLYRMFRVSSGGQPGCTLVATVNLVSLPSLLTITSLAFQGSFPRLIVTLGGWHLLVTVWKMQNKISFFKRLLAIMRRRQRRKNNSDGPNSTHKSRNFVLVAHCSQEQIAVYFLLHHNQKQCKKVHCGKCWASWYKKNIFNMSRAWDKQKDDATKTISL